MTPTDFQQFVSVLTQLWPKLDMNGEQVNVWRMALNKYEAAECIAAARDWKASSSKYPTPACIRNRVRASQPVRPMRTPGRWDVQKQAWGAPSMTDDECELRYAHWEFERAANLYGPDREFTRFKFDEWQRVVEQQGGERLDWTHDGKAMAKQLHDFPTA